MPQIEKRDITRVNMNLPTNIVYRVKDYAISLGLPITQAYTVLLNQALEQQEVLKNMPSLLNTVNDLKHLSNDLKNISNKG